MSKKQHQRQLERARAKRRGSRLDRRRRRVQITAVAAVAALVLSVFAVAIISLLEDTGTPTVDDDPLEEEDPLEGAAEGECPPPDDAPEPEPAEYEDGPDDVVDPEATYVATLVTTCGDIVVELDAGGAPTATNSFVFLAGEGYYEGVGFHRVVPGFVVQGGDPTGEGTGGPGYTFDDELDAAEDLVAEHGGYPRGTLAMANSGPDTNGSQFFVTVAEPTGLDPLYTVFGEVVEGMDVVDDIVEEPAQQQMAIDPVRIVSVEVETR